MPPSAITSRTSESDSLPIAGLLALAMTGFICIMTETMPAGLLPQIAESLRVSEGLAGQTVTSYAAGSLTAAIPLTLITQHWRRRFVLLLTIVGFLVFNSITAFSSSYWLTLAARYFAGAAAGLAWSLLAGYARRMVPRRQQGRALAVAMVGTPIALSLGVPIGTWLGTLAGWRISFTIMSLLALVLIAWVLAKVPDFPGQARSERIPFLGVLMAPGVRSILCVVIAWMLAHNILYTYIVPFIAQAGLAARADLVLLVFGMAALLGIGITARLVDHALRATVLISLAVFAFVSLVFAFAAASPIVIYAGVAVWGVTFGGAATLLQTALADTAREGADVALSLNVVAWNSAIAGGGLLGGALLERSGAESFPLVLALLLAVGLVVALRARRFGFPPGHRLSNSSVEVD